MGAGSQVQHHQSTATVPTQSLASTLQQNQASLKPSLSNENLPPNIHDQTVNNTTAAIIQQQNNNMSVLAQGMLEKFKLQQEESN